MHSLSVKYNVVFLHIIFLANSVTFQCNFSVYQYRSGKKFYNYTILEKLGLRFTEFIDLKSEEEANFVFVTASSSSHMRRARRSIQTFKKIFPNRKLIFYDLGLNKKEIEEVKYYTLIYLY